MNFRSIEDVVLLKSTTSSIDFCPVPKLAIFNIWCIFSFLFLDMVWRDVDFFGTIIETCETMEFGYMGCERTVGIGYEDFEYFGTEAAQYGQWILFVGVGARV